jgi:hypothetical protein
MESSQAESTDLIVTSSNDSSADIWMCMLGAALETTAQAISPTTEPGAQVRLTAISSVRWFAEAILVLESTFADADETTNTWANNWTTATTIG